MPDDLNQKVTTDTEVHKAGLIKLCNRLLKIRVKTIETKELCRGDML
jgi:hypothetical protein